MKAYIRTKTDDASRLSGFEGYDSIGDEGYRCAVVAGVNHIEQFDSGGIHIYVAGGEFASLSYGEIMALHGDGGAVTADIRVTEVNAADGWFDGERWSEGATGGYVGRFEECETVRLAEDGVEVHQDAESVAFIPLATIRAGGPAGRYATT